MEQNTVKVPAPSWGTVEGATCVELALGDRCGAEYDLTLTLTYDDKAGSYRLIDCG